MKGRNNHQLEDLTAVITGAASGIGRQLALDLLQQRCNLLLLDKNSDGLRALQGSLDDADCGPQDAQRRVSCHLVDLADSEAISALSRELRDRPIDLLINNAGVLYPGALDSTALADFREVIAVNLLAPVQLTKALLPQLRQSQRPFIVNVASLAGLIGIPGICAYSTSKFGLVGFSEVLRAELKGQVDVCVVCPTLVRTAIVSHAISNERAPAERSTLMDGVLRWVGADPSRVSRAIIGAIKHRRHLVLVNPDAHLLYHCNRIAPRLGAMLVDVGYRWARRRGIVE